MQRSRKIQPKTRREKKVETEQEINHVIKIKRQVLQCRAQWFCTRNSGLRGWGKASAHGPLQASETR